jgi:transposase
MNGAARVLRPDRQQIGWDMIDLDALLPADHRVRLVWRFVEGLDLGPFYDLIKSREGEAGRPPPDPALLLALWLYATLEGVGSARELDRLCERDLAFRWLCGGVPTNYHGLADFRVDHGGLLDRLLSESVASLLAEGLIDLDEVVIDGTKVKASAGKDSFVGDEGLAKAEQLARERVMRLKAETTGDPGAGSRRKAAAEKRAAEEMVRRTEKALATLDRLKSEKAKRAKSHANEEAAKGAPRVSLSDSEARLMRFADGSFKPGYNMPIAATKGGVVLSVMATDRRNDAGLALPMVEDIARRYGRTPKRLLLDTNLAPAEDIAALADRPDGGILVYAPPPTERDDVKPETLKRRAKERAREPMPIKAWRQRMAEPEAKDIYRKRRRIELVNAHWKNRGFDRLNLRGLAKAGIVGIWNALAHNILAVAHLRATTP